MKDNLILLFSAVLTNYFTQLGLIQEIRIGFNLKILVAAVQD